jgi:hypothetical protein
MAGSLVGALRVALGLDTAEFTAGTKKAKQEAGGLVNDLKRRFEGVAGSAKLATAAIGAIASAALVMQLRSAVNAMDDLSKTAQKIGTSAPELAKLQMAAELSDVSVETLQKAMNRLNIAITGIGPKAKGAAGELGALGITAGTSTTAALAKVAEQFARMPDGAEKSTLAIKLFGKAGAEMIPLLNGGAAGLKAAADEAERFGLVVDGNTARAAEQFNDNLTRLGMLSEGVTRQIAAGLLPTLAAITDRLVDNARVGGTWIKTGQMIGLGIVNIGEAAAVTGNFFGEMTRYMVAMWQAGKALASGQGLGAVQNILNNMNDRNMFQRKYIEAYFDALRADIKNFKPGELAAPAMSNFEFAGGKNAPKVKLPVEFVEESGWALQRLTDAGTPAVLQVNNEALRGIADSMGELSEYDFSVDIIRPKVFEDAERFAQGMAQNLSQAIVYGQSLGDALKSSIKAAAAELLTSGLMNLLLGKSVGGVRGGGLLGAILGIPGFANGTKSAPGGLAMVGERGRELVTLPRGSQVASNSETERMMRNGQGQQSGGFVRVGFEPGLIGTMMEGAVAVSRVEAQASVRNLTRNRLAGSEAA